MGATDEGEGSVGKKGSPSRCSFLQGPTCHPRTWGLVRDSIRSLIMLITPSLGEIVWVISKKKKKITTLIASSNSDFGGTYDSWSLATEGVNVS